MFTCFSSRVLFFSLAQDGRSEAAAEKKSVKKDQSTQQEDPRKTTEKVQNVAHQTAAYRLSRDGGRGRRPQRVGRGQRSGSSAGADGEAETERPPSGNCDTGGTDTGTVAGGRGEDEGTAVRDRGGVTGNVAASGKK